MDGVFAETFYCSLETGLDLYTTRLTEIAEDHARNKWGMKDVRVFLAKRGEERVEYVIVEGTNPVYAHTSFESISYHIDFMGLDRTKV
jgi:hypothetical protein